MKFTFESPSHRSSIFAAFTLLVMLAGLVEIAVEFSAGEGVPTMLDDLAIFFISTAVLVMYCIDYFQQQRSLHELKAQLESVRGKMDEESKSISSQYRAVIQKQFDDWQLTHSEQEVARNLIKGLSFREVAKIRETREKTVRQQAASVYKKAGLSGRHELAGWFFEDLFDPELS